MQSIKCVRAKPNFLLCVPSLSTLPPPNPPAHLCKMIKTGESREILTFLALPFKRQTFPHVCAEVPGP